MVTVSATKPPKSRSKGTIPRVLVMVCTLLGLFMVWAWNDETHRVTEKSSVTTAKSSSVVVWEDNKVDSKADEGLVNKGFAACPYQRMADLTPDERHPVAGPRHMVTPPEGGLLHLVCCQTTKGPLNAVVHENWAMLGARRFLEMVQSGYFQAGVPLGRCIRKFICQFGLNNDPALSHVYRASIQDDPNWLPEGPLHRKNDQGVVRFARGYLAYAGGGKNTRDNQFIVSLDNVPTLAGGSPWEVPFGELVGKHSFEALSLVYTGYDEKGPQQGDMWKHGIRQQEREQFPLLDYITGCAVVDQEIQVVPEAAS